MSDAVPDIFDAAERGHFMKNAKRSKRMLSLLLSAVFCLSSGSMVLAGDTFPIFEVDKSRCTDQYKDLLSTYSLAEKENWNAQQYTDHGLCMICGAYRLPAGYCFADVNLDGIPELLIGNPGIFDGNIRYGYFYGIYTLVNGSPKLLLEREESSLLFVCRDGIIGIHGYNEDISETWELYSLPNYGDTLVLYERLGWDVSLYQDENVWFRNNQLPSDNTVNRLISEEEAMKVVNSYPVLNPEFVKIEEDEKTSHAFYGIWCLGTKDKSEADSLAGSLRSKGYPAGVYLTSEWANLNPEPWYVVSAGEYGSENEANASLAGVQQVCGDAYVKWTGDFIG